MAEADLPALDAGHFRPSIGWLGTSRDGSLGGADVDVTLGGVIPPGSAILEAVRR